MKEKKEVEGKIGRSGQKTVRPWKNAMTSPSERAALDRLAGRMTGIKAGPAKLRTVDRPSKTWERQASGKACPECGKRMERRVRVVAPDPQQSCWHSAWDYCRRCERTQFYPEFEHFRERGDRARASLPAPAPPSSSKASPSPPSGPVAMVMLTRAKLQGLAIRGGFTRVTMRALGIIGRQQKGWQNRLIGREIPEATYAAAMAGRTVVR